MEMFPSTYHIAVQSKLTSSHLLGLNAKLWAYSIPSMNFLYSGHTNADPAYAASTWIQMFSALPVKNIQSIITSEMALKGVVFFIGKGRQLPNNSIKSILLS